MFFYKSQLIKSANVLCAQWIFCHLFCTNQHVQQCFTLAKNLPFHLHNVVTTIWKLLWPCPPSISFKALSIIASFHVDGTTRSLISKTRLMVLLLKITFATHPMCHFHLGSTYNMRQQTFTISKQPVKHSLINLFFSL